MESDWCSSDDLHFVNTPFEQTYTKYVVIKRPPINSQKNCFGFVLCTDEVNERVFISNILSRSDVATSIGPSKTAKAKAVRSYITVISEQSIFYPLRRSLKFC